MFTGLALLCGYGLLGAGWLILKTEGELQQQARQHARLCFLATLVAVGIVSLWTPIMDKDIAQRWFSWPNIAFLSPVPVVTALLGILEWRAIADPKSELRPFIYAVLLFSLSYLGIAISLFPMIVPHHYDLWQAASSADTQIFLGVGTLFLLPVILVYTGWSYWVFRGKVRADTRYH